MEKIKEIINIDLSEEENKILCRAVKLMENMKEELDVIQTCELNKEHKDCLRDALGSMYKLCAKYSCRTRLGINDFQDVD